MNAIQFILCGLLVMIVLYFRRLRTGLLDRLLVTAFGLGAICLVLAPDLTNWIAHRVGVGRGVDVVIYLSIVGIAFSGILLYAQFRFLQGALTELARQVAVANARPAPPCPPAPEPAGAGVPSSGPNG